MTTGGLRRAGLISVPVVLAVGVVLGLALAIWLEPA
jgi:hypothetical protein